MFNQSHRTHIMPPVNHALGGHTHTHTHREAFVKVISITRCMLVTGRHMPSLLQYRLKVTSHSLARFGRVKRTTQSSFEYHCTRTALDSSEQVENLKISIRVHTIASLYHSSTEYTICTYIANTRCHHSLSIQA